MTDFATNVAAKIIFKKAPASSALLDAIHQMVLTFSDAIGLNFVPESSEDAKIFAGDTRAFHEGGDQLFMSYADSDGHQSSLYIVYDCDNARNASLMLTVRTGLLDGKTLNVAWHRTILCARLAADIFRPLIIQVNGVAGGPSIGFNNASDFVGVDSDLYLTPFTWLDTQLAKDFVLQALANARIDVEPHSTGFQILAVADLSQPPPAALSGSMTQLINSQFVYLQISAAPSS
jgi:hypothetical protein